MPDRSKVTVPQTLDEFKVALGKAVVVFLYEQAGNHDYALDGRDAHYIAAAEAWISHYRRQLQVVAIIAKRAMDSGDNPHNSILVDFATNLHGVTTFIQQQCQPRYFTNVFQAGTSQKVGPTNAFLRLVRQLPAR